MKGLDAPRAIVFKGIVRTKLANSSSICMTYAPFSYQSKQENCLWSITDKDQGINIISIFSSTI